MSLIGILIKVAEARYDEKGKVRIQIESAGEKVCADLMVAGEHGGRAEGDTPEAALVALGQKMLTDAEASAAALATLLADLRAALPEVQKVEPEAAPQA